MIRYVQGNLLEAPSEALVNTVNEVGVMGKGIARMFREAFPESSKLYEQAARRGEVRVGHVLVTRNDSLVGPRWIIHFPTKKQWRQPSRLDWVRKGLGDLVRVVRQNHIRSIALPPLGCGNGGLEWTQVRREIEAALSLLPDVEVTVFEPTPDYQNAQKRTGVEELTVARALIAELIRRYSVLGIQCTNLEVHKLAWFLHRVIEARGLPDPMALQFVPSRYGPYADRLRHLLDGLDGSYVHCEKRLSDAGPYEPVWFEDSRRAAVEAFLAGDEGRHFLPALEETAQIIDGFESPLGMELLATVDWLLHEEQCKPAEDVLLECLKRWPGGSAAAARKRRLFDARLIDLALVRLAQSGIEDMKSIDGEKNPVR